MSGFFGGLGLTQGKAPKDPVPYLHLLMSVAKRYRLDWRWLAATMKVESDFGRHPAVARGLRNPSDVQGSISDDGLSWGLMQFILKTANRPEINPRHPRPLTAVDLNESGLSIEMAGRLMRWNLDYFSGDVERAVKAYNGGETWPSKSEVVRTRVARYYEKWVAALEKIKQDYPEA